MNYELMRKARKASKITQDDLATLLGVNRATVSKYETGIIEPPITQQLKIAQILDIDLFVLMDDETIQSYLSANERKSRALDQSGTVVDPEGVIAPVDSYIGQFMKVIKNLDNEGKYDLLLISEFYSETSREDQKQMLRFAAFLASHPKYRNGNDVENNKGFSEAAQFLRKQILSTMPNEDGDPPQEE